MNMAALFAILSLIGALALALIIYFAANSFFERLIILHPELSGAFPKPSFNTRYGPIRPSYMSYLKSRKHLLLPEPELRAEGNRLLHLLYAHAAIFMTFVLFVLWWKYQNGA